MRGVVDTFDAAIIRNKPSVFGDEICFLENGSVLEIDEEASTKDFYKVYNAAGIDGYCMKMYLMVKE